MNIKQHIEAGHYPKDEKGRALVSMRNGNLATICATDGPEDSRWNVYTTIIGFHWCGPLGWDDDGVHCNGTSSPNVDLLPPAPRKVEVKVLAIVIAGTGTVVSIRNKDDPPVGVATGIERLVELTGSYEEPWS